MEQQANGQETASRRINRYLEKFAVWIVGIVIALGSWAWNGMDTRVTKVEERVSFLYQDKVSRQELKDEMNLVRQNMDKGNLEVMSRQEQMKQDITSRLELILKFIGPAK